MAERSESEKLGDELYRKAKSLKKKYPGIRDLVRTNRSIGLKLRNREDMPDFKDRGDARIALDFAELSRDVLGDELADLEYEAHQGYDAIKAVLKEGDIHGR